MSCGASSVKSFLKRLWSDSHQTTCCSKVNKGQLTLSTYVIFPITTAWLTPHYGCRVVAGSPNMADHIPAGFNYLMVNTGRNHCVKFWIHVSNDIHVLLVNQRRQRGLYNLISVRWSSDSFHQIFSSIVLTTGTTRCVRTNIPAQQLLVLPLVVN